MNFSINKISPLNFGDTVSKLNQYIEANSFKVLYTHDVQETFAKKGIEHGPYKIIEFCRAPAAKEVLDSDPMIGLFLPCKFVVFEINDSVHVGVFLPTAMLEFFPSANLGELSKEIEVDIIRILDLTISN